MAIVMCEKKHFYDNDKYDGCPLCKEEEEDEDIRTVSIYGDAKGERSGQSDLDAKTVSFYENTKADDGSLTMRKEETQDLTVGWLVCVEGGSKGRDYRIVSGRNMVGRDYSMAICIQGDETISRINHCAIVYDDRHADFYLMPMDNLVYMDGKMLSGAIEIKTGAEFTIGASRFVFVAFCEEGRTWETF